MEVDEWCLKVYILELWTDVFSMEYWSQIWETLETIPNKKDSTKESCDSYRYMYVVLSCYRLHVDTVFHETYIFILFCFKLSNHILISHVLSFGNMSWETNQRRFMLVTVTCPAPAYDLIITEMLSRHITTRGIWTEWTKDTVL